MLTKSTKAAIIKHAQDCYPRECCGLIINKKYYPCTNICPDDNGFEIDAREYVALTRHDKPQAIVHSHPHGTADASEMDKRQMALHGLTWVIVGKDGDFKTYENN